MNASHESSNLDFLRSCAVLFVVGFHLILYFQVGQPPRTSRLALLHSLGNWGVLIFFVHTCLVLMFSMERQWSRDPGVPIYPSFLLRRFFRIYPLSVFVVLLVCVFQLPVAHLVDGQFVRTTIHWPGILSNLFLIQNLTHSSSIIAPLWSLPYEMEMYFLLPLLFLLVRSSSRDWMIVLLWAAAVVTGRHVMGSQNDGLPQFIVYVPCFLSGVLAYSFAKKIKIKVPSLIYPPALALISLLYLESPSYQRSWYCCLLLGIALPCFGEIRNLFVSNACRIIARYSYGIYLTHFICIWIAFRAIPGFPEWLRWFVFMILLSGIPFLSYHLLEEPGMRWGKRAVVRLRFIFHPAIMEMV